MIADRDHHRVRWARRVGFITAAGILALCQARAVAYDSATTHAGLTTRAVEASRLHQVLEHAYGRPMGVLEPLRLSPAVGPSNAERALLGYLASMDPAGGYRPGPDGVALAGDWVAAGAVLAKTPPERARNHFLDPRTGTGLDDDPGLSGTAHSVHLLFNGGATVRGMATGSAFTLDGRPSVQWVWAQDNPLGIPVFLDGLEHAVTDPAPADRDSALARALLSLGGIVSVLEDAGDPAYVRNDFRGAFLLDEQGDRFARYVAEHYGRTSLPAGSPVSRPTVKAYFCDTDGKGLADRTHRRFFSPGNLPSDVPVAGGSSPDDVLRLVRESLVLPSPTITALDLRAPGKKRYLVVEGRKTLAYENTGRQVHFFLDDAVYADAAAALLPEVIGYSAGLINHLLRASLEMAVADGKVTIHLTGAEFTGSERNQLRVVFEDPSGQRHELKLGPLTASGDVRFAVPPGAKKLAAVMRGTDSAGPFLAAGEVRL